MKANPLTSLGARTERQAMRKHLRRQLSIHGTKSVLGTYIDGLLLWIDFRQSRYDKKSGGLGKR